MCKKYFVLFRLSVDYFCRVGRYPSIISDNRQSHRLLLCYDSRLEDRPAIVACAGSLRSSVVRHNIKIYRSTQTVAASGAKKMTFKTV